MILIRLSAFNGRLLSGVMEWPSLTPTVILPFSRSMKAGFCVGKDISTTDMTFRKAVFEYQGKAILNDKKEPVYLYEMTEV